MFNCLNFVVGEDINNIHQPIGKTIDNIIKDLVDIGRGVDLEDTWADTSKTRASETNDNMIDHLKNATLTKEIINIRGRMIDQIEMSIIGRVRLLIRKVVQTATNRLVATVGLIITRPSPCKKKPLMLLPTNSKMLVISSTPLEKTWAITKF